MQEDADVPPFPEVLPVLRWRRVLKQFHSGAGLDVLTPWYKITCIARWVDCDPILAKKDIVKREVDKYESTIFGLIQRRRPPPADVVRYVNVSSIALRVDNKLSLEVAMESGLCAKDHLYCAPASKISGC